MKDNNEILKNCDLKEVAKKNIDNAKEKKLIKPISMAFKETPTSNEIHKGDKNYYINK